MTTSASKLPSELGAELKFPEVPIKMLERLGARLFDQHYREVCTNRTTKVLGPDWSRYLQLETREAVFAVGAFHGERLIGYSVCLISPNIHYRDRLDVVNDAVFVDPDYRGSGAFQHLLAKSKRLARQIADQRGFKFCGFSMHAKPDSTLHRILAKSSEFHLEDLIFQTEV